MQRFNNQLHQKFDLNLINKNTYDSKDEYYNLQSVGNSDLSVLSNENFSNLDTAFENKEIEDHNNMVPFGKDKNLGSHNYELYSLKNNIFTGNNIDHFTQKKETGRFFDLTEFKVDDSNKNHLIQNYIENTELNKPTEFRNINPNGDNNEYKYNYKFEGFNNRKELNDKYYEGFKNTLDYLRTKDNPQVSYKLQENHGQKQILGGKIGINNKYSPESFIVHEGLGPYIGGVNPIKPKDKIAPCYVIKGNNRINIKEHFGENDDKVGAHLSNGQTSRQGNNLKAPLSNEQKYFLQFKGGTKQSKQLMQEITNTLKQSINDESTVLNLFGGNKPISHKLNELAKTIKDSLVNSPKVIAISLQDKGRRRDIINFSVESLKELMNQSTVLNLQGGNKTTNRNILETVKDNLKTIINSTLVSNLVGTQQGVVRFKDILENTLKNVNDNFNPANLNLSKQGVKNISDIFLKTTLSEVINNPDILNLSLRQQGKIIKDTVNKTLKELTSITDYVGNLKLPNKFDGQIQEVIIEKTLKELLEINYNDIQPANLKVKNNYTKDRYEKILTKTLKENIEIAVVLNAVFPNKFNPIIFDVAKSTLSELANNSNRPSNIKINNGNGTMRSKDTLKTTLKSVLKCVSDICNAKGIKEGFTQSIPQIIKHTIRETSQINRILNETFTNTTYKPQLNLNKILDTTLKECFNQNIISNTKSQINKNENNLDKTLKKTLKDEILKEYFGSVKGIDKNMSRDQLVNHKENKELIETFLSTYNYSGYEFKAGPKRAADENNIGAYEFFKNNIQIERIGANNTSQQNKNRMISAMKYKIRKEENDREFFGALKNEIYSDSPSFFKN